MTIDDDSDLSAYLDGELAPVDRNRVEIALRSDPRLADRLRALTRVHELVSGLDRPSPAVDLSPDVLARIRRRDSRSRLQVGLRSRPRVARAGMAAALVLAVVAGLRWERVRNHSPKALRTSAPAVKKAAAVVSAPTPRNLPDEPELPKASVPIPKHSAPAATAFADDEAKRAQEQREFRKMLDNPNLRKVFLVTDAVGGGSCRQVDDLVANTPRVHSRFGRVTIGQGIVIDPNHPNEATVFAVALNDLELNQFRGALHKVFGERVREDDADPAVVTQLADVGQVAIVPGTPVAAVVATDAPLTDHAIKAVPPAARGDEFEDAERSAPEPERNSPARLTEHRTPGPNGDRAGAPAPSDLAPAPPRRDDSSVVLVWVTSR